MAENLTYNLLTSTTARNMYENAMHALPHSELALAIGMRRTFVMVLSCFHVASVTDPVRTTQHGAILSSRLDYLYRLICCSANIQS